MQVVGLHIRWYVQGRLQMPSVSQTLGLAQVQPVQDLPTTQAACRAARGTWLLMPAAQLLPATYPRTHGCR